jgi:hypothetical protein
VEFGFCNRQCASIAARSHLKPGRNRSLGAASHFP